jgi:hypothetical protein
MSAIRSYSLDVSISVMLAASEESGNRVASRSRVIAGVMRLC